MLDRAVFVREITLLADRFNRDVSEQVLALYFDMLSRELATNSFVAACRQVFYSATFFPSPAEIVAAVRGAPKDQAVLEWFELVEKHNRSERAALSPAGHYAYKAIGGHYAMQSQDAGLLKRDFLEAYLAFNDKIIRDTLPALGVATPEEERG